MKLDGFGIFVKDMPTMIQFYRDVLGFDIKEQEDASNVYLEKDGTLFLLYPRNSFEEMTNRSFNYAPGINGHYGIALRVDSENELDFIFKEVVSKGAAPIMAPKRMEWGQYTSYIADPEGNLIEISA